MAAHREHVSRVTRSKAEAKSAYDRMSRWYDLFSRQSEKKFTEMGLNRLAAKEGETILEIGFGTGHSVVDLASKVGDSGRVYGIDLSSGMGIITRKRVKQAGLLGTVGLSLGDAFRLPFKAESFDAIFISFTLELFDTPEISVVLLECKRVLQDEGRLCIVAMSKRDDTGLMVRLYEWAHEKFPAYADCRPILVGKEVTDAGFEISDIAQESMWGLPVEVVLARKNRHNVTETGL